MLFCYFRKYLRTVKLRRFVPTFDIAFADFFMTVFVTCKGVFAVVYVYSTQTFNADYLIKLF